MPRIADITIIGRIDFLSFVATRNNIGTAEISNMISPFNHGSIFHETKELLI